MGNPEYNREAEQSTVFVELRPATAMAVAVLAIAQISSNHHHFRRTAITSFSRSGDGEVGGSEYRESRSVGRIVRSVEAIDGVRNCDCLGIRFWRRYQPTRETRQVSEMRPDRGNMHRGTGGLAAHLPPADRSQQILRQRLPSHYPSVMHHDSST